MRNRKTEFQTSFCELKVDTAAGFNRFAGDIQHQLAVESIFKSRRGVFRPPERRRRRNQAGKFRVTTEIEEVSSVYPVWKDTGDCPRWRGDGRELYFVGFDRKLMPVDIEARGTALAVGVPHPLYQTEINPLAGLRIPHGRRCQSRW